MIKALQRNFLLALAIGLVYYFSVNHYQVTAKMLNNIMPDNFDFWASLAQEHIAAEDVSFDQSRRYYEKLVKLFPDDTASMNILGYIYFHTHDLGKAQKIYEQSARINPTYMGTYYNLGIVYFLQKDYARAEAAFKRCLVSSSEASIRFIYSARAYLPIRKSIPQFDRFIQAKMEEEFDAAGSWLALSVYLKNFPEVLRGKYRVDPRLAFQDYIYYRLGYEAMEIKQYNAAVGFFQESLNVNPDYLPALHEMAMALQKLGKKEIALKILYKEKTLRQTQGAAAKKTNFPRLQVF